MAPRPEKTAVVNDVKARLEGAAATLLTDYRGLDVGEMALLRAELRKANAEYIVAKNTLAKIGANEAGISGFDDYLIGPTAWVFCEEGPVDAAKVLKAFQKDHPALLIKAGMLDGEILDAEATLKLADLESRDELMTRFAGLMYGALANTARLMNALTEKQARLITAFIEAGGNPDVADTAPTEDAPTTVDEAPAESAQAEEAPSADTAAESTQAAEAPSAEAAVDPADVPEDAATVDAPDTTLRADAEPEEAIDAGGKAIDGGGEIDDATEAAAVPTIPEDEAPATPEEAVAQDVPTPPAAPAPEPADDEKPTAPAAAADEVADDPDVDAASDALDPSTESAPSDEDAEADAPADADDKPTDA